MKGDGDPSPNLIRKERIDMKRVDENYSYDELEGFEPVEMRGTTARPELIQLRLQQRTFILTETAIKALGKPEYVRCMINRDRKLLLVEASDPRDNNAVKMVKTSSISKSKLRFESSRLAGVIEELTNRAASAVNMNFDGAAARSRQNALIFDLKTVQVYEKKAYQKTGKRAK